MWRTQTPKGHLVLAGTAFALSILCLFYIKFPHERQAARDFLELVAIIATPLALVWLIRQTYIQSEELRLMTEANNPPRLKFLEFQVYEAGGHCAHFLYSGPTIELMSVRQAKQAIPGNNVVEVDVKPDILHDREPCLLTLNGSQGIPIGIKLIVEYRPEWPRGRSGALLLRYYGPDGYQES